MKLKNQVCTMEQAKQLKELGIVQDQGSFYWEQLKPPVTEGCSTQRLQAGVDTFHPMSDSVVKERFCAFTTSELGIMLPNGYFTLMLDDGSWTAYDPLSNLVPVEPFECFTAEPHIRAELVIFLLKRKDIGKDAVNMWLTANNR